MNRNIQPRKVYLALDDMRVGGIQRLVMDEAYSLSDLGHEVHIINFGMEFDSDSIVNLDRMNDEILESRLISILSLPQSKIAKLMILRTLVRKGRIEKVICHSPSTAMWFRVASSISLRKIQVFLWIHQVLSLSDRSQATKRVILSMFATKIYFSAIQFKFEWELNSVDRFLRMFRRKQGRAVDRLGIYLPRVLSGVKSFECTSASTHLIYASRLTPWKGLDKFEQLVNRTPDTHPVILTVNLPDTISPIIETARDRKNHLFVCEPPNVIANFGKSVHIYPTDYGDKVKFPQSIGLNVMEFAILGIPSLISREEITTYPQILESPLVEMVDWMNIDEVKNLIAALANLGIEERQEAAKEVQDSCSIESHINTLKSNL
jgi:hypothetical protein